MIPSHIYTHAHTHTIFFFTQISSASMPIKCHTAINGLGGESKKETWGKIQEKPKLMEDIEKQEGKKWKEGYKASRL